MEEIPDWFWDTLAAASPSITNLEVWLEASPKATIESFAFAYDQAARSLCDYWDGITVNGVAYSEDAMEDLCTWVVAQGRELWVSVKSGQLALSEIARLCEQDQRDSGPASGLVRWTVDVADPDLRGCATPFALPYGVYWKRFAEELHGVLNAPGYQPDDWAETANDSPGLIP